MKHIAILLHADAGIPLRNYMIEPLIMIWRSMGIRVSVIAGVQERPEADLLFPHIDLTCTPPEYIAFMQNYPCVVNRGVTDISKRNISTHLLRGDERYDGPAIVKTDRNFGGRARAAVLLQPASLADAGLVAFCAHRGAGAVPSAGLAAGAARLPGLRPPGRCARRGAFHNPALVVEKFLRSAKATAISCAITWCWAIGR